MRLKRIHAFNRGDGHSKISKRKSPRSPQEVSNKQHISKKNKRRVKKMTTANKGRKSSVRTPHQRRTFSRRGAAGLRPRSRRLKKIHYNISSAETNASRHIDLEFKAAKMKTESKFKEHDRSEKKIAITKPKDEQVNENEGKSLRDRTSDKEEVGEQINFKSKKLFNGENGVRSSSLIFEGKPKGEKTTNDDRANSKIQTSKQTKIIPRMSDADVKPRRSMRLRKKK